MDSCFTRIYLLRHGETANYNGVFKYNGHYDVDVTKPGMRQLARQADRLKNQPISAVYSSDLTRALRGAGIIASAHNLEVVQDRRLREIHAGRWEGLSVAEVRAKFGGELETRFDDIVNYRVKGGGENLPDVRERARKALAEITERHRGEELALVAHGGINRIILCDALGLDLENILRIEQDFGCLNIIDYYDGTAVVRLVNLADNGICGL